MLAKNRSFVLFLVPLFVNCGVLRDGTSPATPVVEAEGQLGEPRTIRQGTDDSTSKYVVCLDRDEDDDFVCDCSGSIIKQTDSGESFNGGICVLTAGHCEQDADDTGGASIALEPELNSGNWAEYQNQSQAKCDPSCPDLNDDIRLTWFVKDGNETGYQTVG